MKLWGLRVSSLVGATLVGGALAVVAIAPASADSNPSLSVQYNSSDPLNIPANGGSRTLAAEVFATGDYTGATVTFDFTDLAGVATATLPAADNCTAAGASITCPVPDITDGSTKDFPFPITLMSTGGVATGTVNAFVTYNGADIPATPFDIAVFDGPELDLSQVGELSANPGDSIAMNLDIANLGSQSAPNLLVVYDDSHGVVPSNYDNCLYASWPQDAGTYVACTIPGALAAGNQVALHGGFQATIATDSADGARADAYVFPTSSATPIAPDFWEWAGVTFSPRPASGRTLTTDAVPTDGTIQPGIGIGTTWFYRVNTTADIAVTASQSTISGAVGDSFNLTFGFVDNGAGWLDTWSSHDPSVGFAFLVPTWATVTSAPAACTGYPSPWIGPGHPGAPGYAIYMCSEPDTYFLAPNSPYTVNFGLKLTATAGTAGKVMTGEDGFVPSDDPNGTNNTVTINAGTISTSGIGFAGYASSNGTWTSETVTIPSTIHAGDLMLLYDSANTTSALTAPAGWTLINHTPTTFTSQTSYVWYRVAAAADIGTKVTVGNGATNTKAALVLAGYRGVKASSPIAANSLFTTTASVSSVTSPTVTIANPGTWVVTYWNAKSSAITSWNPPTGQATRATAYGSGGGHMTSLVTDAYSATPPGTGGGLTATTADPGGSDVSWTIALNVGP